MDESMGSLQRVIAVGQAVDLPAGGALIVTAIELWDHGTVVHAVEQLPEFFPPGEPIPISRPLWLLSDDLGTSYDPRGGGGSGSQSQRRTTQDWATRVPPNATMLYIVGPGMLDDQPMRIALT
jgi:hypothetical protein